MSHNTIVLTNIYIYIEHTKSREEPREGEREDTRVLKVVADSSKCREVWELDFRIFSRSLDIIETRGLGWEDVSV